MANTYLISNPFYLQWHDQGHKGGQWNGSRTDRDYTKLDEWTLAAEAREYTFYFTAKQDATESSEIFAMMNDRGGAVETTYGAKIDPSAADTATALRFTPAGTELVFTAGRVISDDPKIKISQTTTQPTCALIWTGDRWLYSYDPSAPESTYATFDCTDPNAAITLGPGPAHTITVTDQTADATRVCGVYYVDSDAAPGANVGLIQSLTSLPDGRTAVPISITAPHAGDWQCTLKLFTELTAYKSSVLRQS